MSIDDTSVLNSPVGLMSPISARNPVTGPVKLKTVSDAANFLMCAPELRTRHVDLFAQAESALDGAVDSPGQVTRKKAWLSVHNLLAAAGLLQGQGARKRTLD